MENCYLGRERVCGYAALRAPGDEGDERGITEPRTTGYGRREENRDTSQTHAWYGMASRMDDFIPSIPLSAFPPTSTKRDEQTGGHATHRNIATSASVRASAAAPLIRLESGSRSTNDKRNERNKEQEQVKCQKQGVIMGKQTRLNFFCKGYIWELQSISLATHYYVFCFVFLS